jgi:drug/metabolite transporter (DMT)-like permease
MNLLHRRPDLLPSFGIAVGAVLWGLFWLPVRAIEQAGVSAMWSGPVIFASVTFLFLPVALWRWRNFAKVGARLVGTCALAAFAFVLYATSFNLTEVVRTLLLFYLTPLWSTVLGIVVLREHLSVNRVLGLVLAFCGLMIVLGAGIQFPWPRNIGDWFALVSGLCWSFACVGLFQGGTTHIFEKTFMFVFFGFSASVVLALLPLGLDNAIPQLFEVVEGWPWLITVSVLMFPAAFLTIWPPTILSPGRAGILFSLEIVVGVGSAALWANEVFGLREILGTILIMSAAVVEVFRHKPAT